MCRHVRLAYVCYFSLLSVFGACTCKVLTQITCSRTEKIHTKKYEVVQACTHISTRELHSDLLPDTHVYYQGWCWRKGLVVGQRSRQWDLMAKAEIGSLVREHGLAEVQKQRESQIETLDKHRNNQERHHREMTKCMFRLSVKKNPEIQQTKN